MPASSHNLGRIDVTFDHDNAVADAGLVWTGMMMGRLGFERLLDDTVTLGYHRDSS